MSYYVIKVHNIPKLGRNIDASVEKDEWFKRLIRDAVSEEVKSFKATLSAVIGRIDKSIELTGGVYIIADLECDRCLVPFTFEKQIPFRMLMEPKPPKVDKLNEEGLEDISESLDFSFYSGEEIDIGELIRQHVVMAQPISYVCNEDCKGLCPKCAKNLNKGHCKCGEEHPNSPFAVLKDYKSKVKSGSKPKPKAKSRHKTR